VGSFHNQFLVNLIEYLAISTAHVICLSERRLHRMMDENQTGLNPQLAPRPGLDAGMVVAHKACIDLTARVRMAAQPLSLMTSETSGGQEDYMSMAVPVIQRLLEIVRLGVAVLTYEALAGCVALDQRQAVFGAGVTELYDFVRAHIPPLDKDRSPGEDFEIIHHQICGEYFAELDLGSQT
jgi:histidine ammonia-lyase